MIINNLGGSWEEVGGISHSAVGGYETNFTNRYNVILKCFNLLFPAYLLFSKKLLTGKLVWMPDMEASLWQCTLEFMGNVKHHHFGPHRLPKSTENETSLCALQPHIQSVWTTWMFRHSQLLTTWHPIHIYSQSFSSYGFSFSWTCGSPAAATQGSAWWVSLQRKFKLKLGLHVSFSLKHTEWVCSSGWNINVNLSRGLFCEKTGKEKGSSEFRCGGHSAHSTPSFSF